MTLDEDVDAPFNVFYDAMLVGLVHIIKKDCRSYLFKGPLQRLRASQPIV